MKEQLTFPFNHWNYGHNRNYLSYIQEQLGMVSPRSSAHGSCRLRRSTRDAIDDRRAAVIPGISGARRGLH